MLSLQQQADFAEQGFVLLPGFLNRMELDELELQLDNLLTHIVPTMPRDQVFYEDKSAPGSLKQLQQLGQHDAWFRRLWLQGRFPLVASKLLDAPVTPKNLQYFNKPPGVGQPTPPHQDGFYFKLAPCEAVTMWLALDHVNEANGCVRYVPRSHRQGLLPHHQSRTLGFSQTIAGYFESAGARQEVAITANPGDLLVHHALTIHRADGNRTTDQSRRALGFIYYSQNAREDQAAHEAYQRQLAANLAADGLI